MNYLKLANGKRYGVMGYSTTDGFQVSVFPDGSVIDTYADFGNATATETMILEDSDGEALKVFKGYTTLKSLSMVADVLVSGDDVYATIVQAIFAQPDRMQEQVTELQAAVIELAGLIGG